MLDNVEASSSYRLILFAVNAKGRSEPVIIDDISFKGVAKFTGTGEFFFFLPFSTIARSTFHINLWLFTFPPNGVFLSAFPRFLPNLCAYRLGTDANGDSKGKRYVQILLMWDNPLLRVFEFRVEFAGEIYFRP